MTPRNYLSIITAAIALLIITISTAAPTGVLNVDDIPLVHLSPILPSDCILRPHANDELATTDRYRNFFLQRNKSASDIEEFFETRGEVRTTSHFSMFGRVPSETHSSEESTLYARQYGIVLPLGAVRHQIISLAPFDTATIGTISLSSLNGSVVYVFVPKGTNVDRCYETSPSIKLVRYQGDLSTSIGATFAEERLWTLAPIVETNKTFSMPWVLSRQVVINKNIIGELADVFDTLQQQLPHVTFGDELDSYRPRTAHLLALLPELSTDLHCRMTRAVMDWAMPAIRHQIQQFYPDQVTFVDAVLAANVQLFEMSVEMINDGVLPDRSIAFTMAALFSNPNVPESFRRRLYFQTMSIAQLTDDDRAAIGVISSSLTDNSFLSGMHHIWKMAFAHNAPDWLDLRSLGNSSTWSAPSITIDDVHEQSIARINAVVGDLLDSGAVGNIQILVSIARKDSDTDRIPDYMVAALRTAWASKGRSEEEVNAILRQASM